VNTPMTPQDFGLTKAAYSVNETLSVLSIGRTSLYRLVQNGELKATKLGSKTLFCAPDIAALLNRLRDAPMNR
jgi:excisionase family DNA binding protein